MNVLRIIFYTCMVLLTCTNTVVAAQCQIPNIAKEQLQSINKEQFRKQKFGSKPGSDFKLAGAEIASKVYRRPTDTLSIADIKLDAINYYFSNHYGFYLAEISTNGKNNIDKLNTALEIKYNKPDYIRPADDGSTTLIWQRGEKLITHKFNDKNEFTSVLLISAREIEDAVEDYSQCVVTEKLRKALENDL